jgi:hypothetical protein
VWARRSPAAFVATKFASGAWVVVLTVPALMLLFSRIQNYHHAVGTELDLGRARTARYLTGAQTPATAEHVAGAGRGVQRCAILWPVRPVARW